jgi:hypothetical protein
MSRPGDEPDAAGMIETALGRLYEAMALVTTIEDRGLLAELPAGEAGRQNHQAAVSMLAILRRELEGVSIELDAAVRTREALEGLRARRQAR